MAVTRPRLELPGLVALDVPRRLPSASKIGAQLQAGPTWLHATSRPLNVRPSAETVPSTKLDNPSWMQTSA